MVAVGMFGKMPAFGDFVSVGTGTPAYREFEHWLERSNDAMAERGLEMGKDPVGFMIRHEDTGSVLVGILVGSCDSVGRTFPLGLFYEVGAAGLALPGLVPAMASDLARLASIARKARQRGHEEIKTLVRAQPLPDAKDLSIRCQAQLYRLRIVKATMMFERTYGQLEDGVFYGTEAIQRACELAPKRRQSAPLVLEGKAHTDIELMFLHASVDAMSGGRQPGSVLWEVRNHRTLLVLAKPDERLLALLVGRNDADRVWPVWTDRAKVAQRARESLGPELREVLEDPSAISAKEFLDSVAVACKPRLDDTEGASKERQRKWQRRVL